jgi:branched-chain amino acid transport system ATP-binding protein
VAERALHLVGLGHAASLAAGRLPYGDLRRLEIARLLALSPQFLMLDEPAAGMDAPETEALAQALLAIRDRWDVTLLVVEHDIGLVRTVADDVHVLEFGKLLASGPAHHVLSDPRVIKAYLGARHA